MLEYTHNLIGKFLFSCLFCKSISDEEKTYNVEFLSKECWNFAGFKPEAWLAEIKSWLIKDINEAPSNERWQYLSQV